jgi:uncharacterized spore protein YtfJ
MQLEELLGKAQDSITVHKVFAPPLEKDGITVIPAARVAGGGGGGGGNDQQGQQGEGGGFGMQARPAGVYVIRDGRVQWPPPRSTANRVVGAVAAVVVVFLVTRAWRARARASS